MSNATWTREGRPFGGKTANLGGRKITSTSRTAAMQAMGSVVYAARLEDGTIKIGWTQRFEDRLRYLSAHSNQDVELLAFMPGTRDDEQAIHQSLAAHVAYGREYYHATSEVVAVVNGMREALRMPPIAA